MTNKIGLFFILMTTLFQLSFSHSAVAEEHVWKVADNVYRYGDASFGYYSLFIVTDDGVIVIDPMSVAHSKGMLKAIKKLTTQPIKYLFYSHNHWDHTKGGQVFRDQGANIIAHKEADEWMKANPHADLVLPDQVWSGNRHDMTLGGQKIELHYFGINHGLGMTTFILPKEKIAYIADLVTPNRMPFAIADFNIKALMATLDELVKMDFSRVVFSHSHAQEPVGGKSDIIDTQMFFTDLQNAIFAEFNKGTSFYQMPTKLTLPKYEPWDFYNEWLPINTWNMMFQLEMGPFPWRVVDKEIEVNQESLTD